MIKSNKNKNKTITIAIFIIVIIALTLASCGGEKNETLTPTTSPTETMLRTLTVEPNHTSTPTRTPLPLPTIVEAKGDQVEIMLVPQTDNIDPTSMLAACETVKNRIINNRYSEGVATISCRTKGMLLTIGVGDYAKLEWLERVLSPGYVEFYVSERKLGVGELVSNDTSELVVGPSDISYAEADGEVYGNRYDFWSLKIHFTEEGTEKMQEYLDKATGLFLVFTVDKVAYVSLRISEGLDITKTPYMTITDIGTDNIIYFETYANYGGLPYVFDVIEN